MTRVLLDTDVVLDFLLDRQPFSESALGIWEAAEHGVLQLYVSAITPLNEFYVARKLKGEETARLLVSSLLAVCQVCTLEHALLLDAHASPMRDFEDAVQAVVAKSYQLDALVTRNLKDYAESPVKVVSPAELLESLK